MAARDIIPSALFPGNSPISRGSPIVDNLRDIPTLKDFPESPSSPLISLSQKLKQRPTDKAQAEESDSENDICVLDTPTRVGTKRKDPRAMMSLSSRAKKSMSPSWTNRNGSLMSALQEKGELRLSLSDSDEDAGKKVEQIVGEEVHENNNNTRTESMEKKSDIIKDTSDKSEHPISKMHIEKGVEMVKATSSNPPLTVPRKARKSMPNGRTARKSMGDGARASPVNIAHMTLQLKEIEKTLGIKALSDVDDRTLDKLILKRAKLPKKDHSSLSPRDTPSPPPAKIVSIVKDGNEKRQSLSDLKAGGDSGSLQLVSLNDEEELKKKDQEIAEKKDKPSDMGKSEKNKVEKRISIKNEDREKRKSQKNDEKVTLVKENKTKDCQPKEKEVQVNDKQAVNIDLQYKEVSEAKDKVEEKNSPSKLEDVKQRSKQKLKDFYNPRSAAETVTKSDLLVSGKMNESYEDTTDKATMDAVPDKTDGRRENKKDSLNVEEKKEISQKGIIVDENTTTEDETPSEVSQNKSPKSALKVVNLTKKKKVPTATLR